MYMKIHDSPKGKVVAVCDEELVGTVLRGEGREMDLAAHRAFYVGERAGEAEVRVALRDFASANLVGKEAVSVALNMGVADRSDVMYINKTPYIQIYKI